MSTPLDSILSGASTAAPEQENKDEQTVTQTATEAEGQTEQQTESQSTEGESDGGQKTVPHAALHAERQKVKRYTEEVADFRKSNEALQRQVAELMQRIPVPKQEQPQAPDFFENPQAATRHELTQAITPEFERVNQALMAQAQMLAGIKYGDDKVQEAEQAFMTAYQTGKLDPADFQRVAGSPNRYAAAAEWHKRQLAQAEIGDDPAAFRAKLEAELREKITAEFQQGNGGLQQPPAVTPSNLAAVPNKGSRGGPAWSGPASLNDIFARK